jgi:hypothetical protein
MVGNMLGAGIGGLFGMQGINPQTAIGYNAQQQNAHYMPQAPIGMAVTNGYTSATEIEIVQLKDRVRNLETMIVKLMEKQNKQPALLDKTKDYAKF